MGIFAGVLTALPAMAGKVVFAASVAATSASPDSVEPAGANRITQRPANVVKLPSNARVDPVLYRAHRLLSIDQLGCLDPGVIDFRFASAQLAPYLRAANPQSY
ncbi:MAG: hypothetical protein LH481_16995 [Burkholderiales bacterium]|nr:hypothetical protein [Burkholderiales bacterium]